MRVLLTCQSTPGHLNPNRGLAYALRGRGHDVALYSGEAARGIAERDGLSFYPFEPEMDRHLSSLVLPQLGSSAAGSLVDRKWMLFRRSHVSRSLNEWFVRTIPQQIQDLERILGQFEPDLLVNDVTLMGPTLVMRELCRVPMAVFSVIPACPLPGPEVPPWGRGLSRGRGRLGRWTMKLQRGVADWIVSGYKHAVDDMRRRYGLGPLSGRVADEYGKTRLFLMSGTPLLDYRRCDLPPSVRYVGVCMAPIPDGRPVPAWLASLRRDKPTVYATEGTIHVTEPVLLKAVAAGLGGLPVQVILSTGEHRGTEDLRLGPLAPNIRVERYIPHELLLGQVDLLATTGGAGTVCKALMAGVPILVVPIGWEHRETAQRLAESGAGLRLEASQCTPVRLRRMAQRILADPSFAASARRIGAEMAAQGGAERAAQLLEEVAGQPRVAVSA